MFEIFDVYTGAHLGWAKTRKKAEAAAAYFSLTFKGVIFADYEYIAVR